MEKEKIKERKKHMHNSKGITLIALIITIVVLLILAVVTIRAVTGKGIIQHAKNATSQYKENAEKEDEILKGYVDKIEENVSGDNGDGNDETTYAVLIDGPTFNRLIPTEAISLIFTNDVAPDEATLTDVSEAQDGSIVAWMTDDKIYKVSTQNENKIYANKNSGGMFGSYNYETDTAGDTSLKNITFDNFYTENVENMSWMFEESHFENLDLSNFDTSKVKSMSGMFSYCYSLTSIDGLSNFNTQNVTSMFRMFGDCYNLSDIDLSNFKTINVTDMSYMFSGLNLTSLDLSSFNTENVEDMEMMFSYCFNLTFLDLSNFNTSNVTNMEAMFKKSSNLTLDCSGWNVDKVTSHNFFNTDAPGVTAPTWVK